MTAPSHDFANGTLCYDQGPIVWVSDEDCLHDDTPPTPRHTVNGKTSDEGWGYGVTHDMDCPGCQDTSFLASPRSETYWSS